MTKIAVRWLAVVAVVCVVAFAVQALSSGAQAAGNPKCPRGARQCDASQVGQPCDPSRPGIICSAQLNGSYCCLAYVP